MKIVKENITPMQLMFSVAAFTQGAVLLSAFFIGVLKQNTWIAVIIAYLVTLLLLWIYLTLLSKYPGKSLIEINDEIFGRIIGKLISLLYVFFFYSLVVLNTGDITSFITAYIMPETPSVIISLMFILVCILAARKGMDSIARYSTLFSVIQLIVLAIFTVLLISEMKGSNFLPMLNIPVKNFIQGTHTIISVPFCDTIVFMMIIPNVTDQKKAKRSYYKGLTIGAAVLLIIVLTDTAVLGPLLEYFSQPRFESVQLIDVAEIFSRMDILYALVLIILRFFKVSVLLYASTLALAQLCGLKQYVPLVAVLGVLAACTSLFVFSSSAESADWGIHTAVIYSSFFEIVLPVLSLIVYSLRKLFTKREVVKT